MEQGLLITREFSGTKGMGARLTLQEYFDDAKNCHKLEITEFALCSGSYAGVTYYLGSPENSGSICIDGLPLVTFRNQEGSHGVTPGKDYTPVALEKAESTVFSGNDDGTAACQLTVDVYGYSVTGGGANGFRLQLTEALTLTTIPRASAVGATDACIGSVSLVTVTPRRQNVRHSVAVAFAALSGFLTDTGTLSPEEVLLETTAVSFRIPEAFYEQIPEKPGETCLFTCKTYENGSLLGRTEATCFVTADPRLCAPKLSAWVKDTDPAVLSLTGDDRAFVPGYSDLLCTWEAGAQYGASVAEVMLDRQVLTEGSFTISNGETGSFLFAARDSRGYVTETAVSLRQIPYVPLSLHGWAKRLDQTDGTVRVHLEGTVFTGSFGNGENQLTLTCRIDGMEEQVLVPVLEQGRYLLDTVLSGISYDRSHSLRFTARDLLGSARWDTTIPKGVPVFDWGEKDFAFHVPVKLHKGFVSPKETFLGAYPVGAVFLSVADQDPGAFFGGRWEKLENTNLPFYAWQRREDSTAILGQGLVGAMILGKDGT